MMGLTLGTGPFGERPAGAFNFAYEAPAHVLYLEDSPRRVRVVAAGETVADSRRVKLLHETSVLPVCYLPVDDVRTDLLERTDHATYCPFKGEATYWSIRVGDDVRQNAVWGYPEPLDGCPDLAGRVAFLWKAVDEWYEEDEQVHVHPTDPYHRVDVRRSDRQVVVRLGGEIVADSRRPTMLFETGLPPRFYLPPEDVLPDRLAPSETLTACAYKGTVSRYHHVVASHERVEDAAWVYETPAPEATRVKGLIGFHHEKLDVEVDGAPWQP